jgi:2'-5' RNA ligase
VTVLYPFVDPRHIDHRVLHRVAEAIGTVPAFDVTFARTSWFGDTVLWLAPEPEQPFRTLTGAAWAGFPDHPPYQGAYADSVPHLTVGHDAPVEVLRAAADAIRPQLPIRAQVTTVQLIQGSAEPDSWHTVADFPLASPR